MIKKPLPVHLLGNRIELRRHKLNLASKMFQAVDQDRERLRQFLPWVDAIQSEADERAYIRSTQAAWKACTLFDYGIFLKDSGVYLGNLGVHHLAWAHERCELGYWMIGAFEGQGYMTEAVQVLEKQLFESGFNRIEIRCSTLNHRSAGVPERLGYSLEGKLRREAMEMGAWRDTFIYAKLKDD
ncbi:N-acetyltransferase [bacterium (Candidatus Blackallbacteria) CG17_big_fil_post_rev_8_21_14_2_50_48_46]|uniref:N-acetyltransferase n=1 Tax=bacterium (Candidatus Blackallbacteria) CG17_big_fil_post_rev_8_21_14_2_50_48_46 TaxID=2014261 RepID=A0A2M7G946_9BACT|nr:MAG: hypothetical protein COW64_04180 [bacterium (Candidatus Blackallbacteria) CG18_big_fil_WC_8_21_14_2_50_49_26]PIW18607.1 MAG: N-acetyltransferase [bacterium (Candidatus Blackallbacteria) CG17_big_fil_post_rev_8_21_14_2_50_48_46]PIW46407.1 MAG: N-acetyltransferase [bacterium (Candidatus Blackallbacteria) CG13_big_fil_rev_8_21_14_2_50_49_14]